METVAPGTIDDTERDRQRRRHPAERRVSRYSGLLLIVIIAQAAFGYALAGLTNAPWVRTVHLLGAVLVLGLAWHVPLAARKIPWRSGREKALLALGWPLAVLASLQLAYGLGLKGWFPFISWPTRNLHIGVGLFITFIVVGTHILAIFPSLALSARREHEKSLAALRERDA